MGISRCVVLKATKLGRYSRTTVPEEVRKLLDLHEGDMMAWILENGNIVVEKMN